MGLREREIRDVDIYLRREAGVSLLDCAFKHNTNVHNVSRIHKKISNRIQVDYVFKKQLLIIKSKLK